jgi:hypothetical protein
MSAKVIFSPRAAIPALALVLLIDLGMLVIRRSVWLPYYRQGIACTGPILVLTSDDWGGASPEETTEDLDRLATMLRSLRDRYGNPLRITAYLVAASPDFAKVEETGYREYFWRFCYADKPDVVAKWRSLCNEGLCEIQFHGREHYNVPLWLSLLRADKANARKACHEGRTPHKTPHPEGWDLEVAQDPRLGFLARSFIDASVEPPRALNVESQTQIVKAGLDLVERHFGTRPAVAVAPGHVWDTNTLEALRANGIRFLESECQRIVVAGPALQLTRSRDRWRYGCRTGVGVLVRIAHFEPVRWYGDGSLNEPTQEGTMADLRQAAAARVPLVLQTHKQSYVGRDQRTTEEAVRRLGALIRAIQVEFPDVEFMSASAIARCLSMPSSPENCSMPVRVEKLSGLGKILYAARRLWAFHWQFRLLAYATAAAVIWGVISAACSLVRRLRQDSKVPTAG